MRPDMSSSPPLPLGEGRRVLPLSNRSWGEGGAASSLSIPTWGEGPAPLTDDSIWTALSEVMDPEIPVLSLVDLGVIRAVLVTGDGVAVTMTPTFSGCPALMEMRRLIEERLRTLGAATVTVNTVLAPAWTSDWISAEGRRKLKAFGLAPPPLHGGDVQIMLYDVVHCPRCDSGDVTVRNTFGSTLCRAIYYCNRCQDAFEQFKPL